MLFTVGPLIQEMQSLSCFVMHTVHFSVEQYFNIQKQCMCVVTWHCSSIKKIAAIHGS